MAYQDKLQNLKVEFMNKKAKIKLKPQTALAVHIDFDILLNTDLNWIIKEIRKAIKEEIQVKYTQEKRLILTFSIDQVSTKHSIDLIITTGLIDPEIIELFRGIGAGIATYLIIKGFERLKNRGISKGVRPNIRHVEVKKVIYHPDGRIEYSESEEDSFTIE